MNWFSKDPNWSVISVLIGSWSMLAFCTFALRIHVLRWVVIPFMFLILLYLAAVTVFVFISETKESKGSNEES